MVASLEAPRGSVNGASPGTAVMDEAFAAGSAATAAASMVAAAAAAIEKGTTTWAKDETKVVESAAAAAAAAAATLRKTQQTAQGQGQRQGRVPSVASDSSDVADDTDDCDEEEEEVVGATSPPPRVTPPVALEVPRTTAFATTTKAAPAAKGQRPQRSSKKTAAAAAAAEEEEEDEDHQTLEASGSTAAATRLDAIHIADPADDTRTLLIGHLYGIGGRKVFKCGDCKKAFPSKSKLERHSRVHTRHKPFRCDKCDTCFTQKSSLKIHRAKHVDRQYLAAERTDRKSVERQVQLRAPMSAFAHGTKSPIDDGFMPGMMSQAVSGSRMHLPMSMSMPMSSMPMSSMPMSSMPMAPGFGGMSMMPHLGAMPSNDANAVPSTTSTGMGQPSTCVSSPMGGGAFTPASMIFNPAAAMALAAMQQHQQQQHQHQHQHQQHQQQQQQQQQQQHSGSQQQAQQQQQQLQQQQLMAAYMSAFHSGGAGTNAGFMQSMPFPMMMPGMGGYPFMPYAPIPSTVCNTTTTTSKGSSV